jgi:hypothetical protein
MPNYIQCTEGEEESGKCNDTYAYIGNRYKDVWPYTEIYASDRKFLRPVAPKTSASRGRAFTPQHLASFLHMTGEAGFGKRRTKSKKSMPTSNRSKRG